VADFKTRHVPLLLGRVADDHSRRCPRKSPGLSEATRDRGDLPLALVRTEPGVQPAFVYTHNQSGLSKNPRTHKNPQELTEYRTYNRRQGYVQLGAVVQQV
jgi:hypothetical protein